MIYGRTGSFIGSPQTEMTNFTESNTLNSFSVIDDLKQRVEEIGIFFESTGLTPLEARVFALLLLNDPPEMDFFAIQEFLNASKSSISNALKRLQTEERVDYITRPGDRRRYFRVNPQKWLRYIQASFARITPFLDTMDTILELRRDTESPAFNQDLQRINEYFIFLGEELPRMQARWEKRVAENSSS